MEFTVEHLSLFKFFVTMSGDPCVSSMSVPTATFFLSTDEPDGFSLASLSLTMIQQLEISRSVRYRWLIWVRRKCLF